MGLLDPLFGSAAMSAVFSDGARLQRMLDFEAALARAEARCGVIPAAAAQAIASKCKADLIDADALATSNRSFCSTLPSPWSNNSRPWSRKTTRKQRGLSTGAPPARTPTTPDWSFRFGTRSISSKLTWPALCGALIELAQKHRSTPMAGRTLMQHALPTTFGVKVAGWLDAMNRHRERLSEIRKRALVLQFGGAVGTLAALREKGLQVAEALAAELHLALPDAPWHTQRDRVAEVATTLGLCVGTLGKMARDISLHMQTEISRRSSNPPAKGAADLRLCRTNVIQ